MCIVRGSRWTVWRGAHRAHKTASAQSAAYRYLTIAATTINFATHALCIYHALPLPLQTLPSSVSSPSPTSFPACNMAFAVASTASAFVAGRPVNATCTTGRPAARAASLRMSSEKDKYKTVGDKAQDVRNKEESGEARGAEPTAPGATKDAEGSTNIYAKVPPVSVSQSTPTNVPKIAIAIAAALLVGAALVTIVPFDKPAEIAVEQGEATPAEVGLSQ